MKDETTALVALRGCLTGRAALYGDTDADQVSTAVGLQDSPANLNVDNNIAKAITQMYNCLSSRESALGGQQDGLKWKTHHAVLLVQPPPEGSPGAVEEDGGAGRHLSRGLLRSRQPPHRGAVRGTGQAEPDAGRDPVDHLAGPNGGRGLLHL